MNAVVLMVVHVIANEPSRCCSFSAMIWSLRNPVLPGCLNTRALRAEARRLQERNHIAIEFRVVVEDGITIRTSLRKRFSQLLHHPISSRMTSDVEVQNPAPAMLDYEEAVQELERQGGHGKEVEGNDHLTMVSKEGEPSFGSIAASPQALQISGDRAFGDFEAELQKFPVDLRCSPVRIFSRHAANESPNLLAHPGSTATRPRSPAPVQAKARPMPSDHRLRFHNDQNIRPSAYMPQRGPEEAVEAVQ